MKEKKIYKLHCRIQDYDWGTKDQLQKLLGIANPENKPQAEIWMGAHVKAPSTVSFNDGGKELLHRFIKDSPGEILGEDVHARFDAQLPFLFKVLSAASPLSIQAHPDKGQAKNGYERETLAEVSLSARERNYKDANHKPELICALTPFKALNGFREISEMLSLLEELAVPALQKDLEIFKANPCKEGLKKFYTKLMTEGREKHAQAEIVRQAVNSAARKNKSPIFQELLNLHGHYKDDIGILCPLLLNLVELQPGEAMYLQAGVLHAYLRGTGMEIMANSDNVLRGGLTPKHVAVDELLASLTFDSGPVTILLPKESGNCRENVYTTRADEFVLSVLEIKGETFYSPEKRNVEILFCAEGRGRISYAEESEELELIQGAAYLIPAAVPGYGITGN
ncbi:MAG: mannose-6-phosphate isomerase, class I, partial [bacterium]|nr:mannose-6-phosphate isomerase, class I [bacterium]